MFITLFAFISFSFAFDKQKCSNLTKIIGTKEAYTIATVDEAFNCIETFEFSKENKTVTMEMLYKMIEGYIFKDILKNPPQPNGDNTYYSTLDIDSELQRIKGTNYSNFYSFFNDIWNMFVKTGDNHFNFYVNGQGLEAFNFLALFLYTTFFDFEFKGTDVYIVPKQLTYALKDKYSEIQDIENNRQKKVQTINGEEPTEFIRKFGKQFVQLKCPHAKFTQAKVDSVLGSLASKPLPKSYLNTPIKVKYEGIDKIAEYKYYTIFVNSQQLSQSAQRKLEKHINGKEKTVLKGDEIFETEEEYQIKQSLKKNSNLPERKYGEDSEEVYCFVDKNQGMNTFVLTTFNPEDEDEFFEIIGNCLTAFYQNTYPIQIIMNKNGGGVIAYEQNIEKLFGPYNDVRLLLDIRISNAMEELMKLGGSEGMVDLTKCKALEKSGELEKLGEWYTKPRIIKYGNVEHKVTQMVSQAYDNTLIKEFSKEISKFRKPTEIVVYTDSYCFSCCSIFTKGLKEHGSAILVGFDGDPKATGTDKFDVGQSPTSVIDINEVLKSTGADIPFTKLGLTLRVSIGETFRYNYKYDETIPREFLIDEIDERSNLDYYNDLMLNQFTTKTKEIVEKYKTKCNPKNKRLVDYDSKCDTEVKKIDSHAHGGYACGTNGEWDKTKCVIAYCDFGYFYDSAQNKCIPDPCNPTTESNGNNGNKNNGSVTMNIIFMIMMIIGFLF